MNQPSCIALSLLLLSACHSSTSRPPDDEPASDAVLNLSNHVTVITEVFDVFRGEGLEASRLLEAGAYHRENTPISTDYDYLDTGEVRQIVHRYACINGGNAVVTRLPFLASDREIDTVFDQCQWQDDVYDGRLIWYWPPFSGVQSTYQFDAFSLRLADGRLIEIDGRFGIDSAIVGSNVHQGDYHVWQMELTRLHISDGDSKTLQLESAETAFGYGRDRVNNPTAALDGQFRLRSAATGEHWLSVTVAPEFSVSDTSERYFPVGSLQVSADDASEIRLQARPDVPSLLTLTLTEAGATQQLDAYWDTWYGNLTFESVQ